MSWGDGVPAVKLFANTSAYPAAAAASAAQQNLMTAASGNAEQPYIPFGFLEQGKPGQVNLGHAVGTVTGQASATTMILTLNLSPTIGGAGTNTAILATAAYTVTSFANVAWELDFKIVWRTVGFGTTSVSSSPYVTGNITLNPAAGPPTTAISDVVIPAQATTIDASVTQWMNMGVTFSTASATNSCTLQQFILFGMT